MKKSEYNLGHIDGYVKGYEDGFHWGVLETRKIFLKLFSV